MSSLSWLIPGHSDPLHASNPRQDPSSSPASSVAPAEGHSGEKSTAIIRGRIRKDNHPCSCNSRLITFLENRLRSSEIRSALVIVALRLWFREHQSRLVIRDKRRRPAQARSPRKATPNNSSRENPSVSSLVSQIDETTLFNKLAALNDQRYPLYPLIPFALLAKPNPQSLKYSENAKRGFFEVIN